MPAKKAAVENNSPDSAVTDETYESRTSTTQSEASTAATLLSLELYPTMRRTYYELDPAFKTDV
jgi:hypothetical protein